MTKKRYKLVNPNNSFKDMNIGIVEDNTCMLKLTDVVELLNSKEERIKEYEKELKRCREWINSDKNDYEVILAFIRNKGFSLQDVLNYEKTLKIK